MDMPIHSENIVQTIGALEQTIQRPLPDAKILQQLAKQHPMQITHYYLDLIDWDDPQDPIRKIAIPSLGEQKRSGTFDTSGEHVHTKFQGLQHKYRETVLILTTNRCAVYCRHCFRKRLVGLVDNEVVVDWDPVVAYLRAHREVTNVLLSGGDPLTLATDHLEAILRRLARIPHLQYVRIGSRIPVVLPHRILDDDSLHAAFRAFASSGKQLYVTTQFNHPRELTATSIRSVQRLQADGVILNNQTVLLKGVNDCPSVMADLQAALARAGVIPYYIFQCRPVTAVMDEFQVPLHDACQLIDEARKQLDGLSKRFRFVMSHLTGKIEILGWNGGGIYAKYHQTNRPSLHNKLFHKRLGKDVGWLDLDG